MKKTIFVGLIIVALATSIGAIGLLNIPSVYATANCDEAGEELNEAGNLRGNVKKCGFGGELEGPKEPVRNCDSPNNFKNNDGDGIAGCRGRGNN